VPLSDSERQLLMDDFSGPSVRDSLLVASREDPDRHAENLRLAESQDAPVQVVKSMPEGFKQRDRLKDIDPNEITTRYPGLTKHLSDPDNASISLDDLDNLKGLEESVAEKGFLERRADDIVRGTKRGLGGFSLTQADKAVQIKGLMDIIDREGFTHPYQMKQYLQANGLPPGIPRRVERYIRNEKYRDRMRKMNDAMIVTEVKDTVSYQSQASQIPLSAARQTYAQAETFGEAWDIFLRNPVEISTSFMSESLPQFAPAMPFMFVNPALAMSAGGLMSMQMEYGADLVESFRDAGLDTDEYIDNWRPDKDIVKGDKLVELLSDPEKMQEWRSHAMKRSIPIALIDAFSAGIGGQFVRMGKSPLQKLGAATGEALIMQPTLGMAGEVAGTLTAGDELHGPSILAEGFGEIPMGVVETAGGAFRTRRQILSDAVNKEVEASLRAIQDQQTIDQIVTLAQSSKTRERAQDRFTAFLNGLNSDKQIYLSADVAAQIPDAPDFITEQLDGTGADVAIPVARFASEMALDQNTMQLIRPHIKTDPDGLTQADLLGGENAKIEALMKRAAHDVENRTVAEEVVDEYVEQLVATGRMTESEANLSVTQVESYLNRVSQEYGISVREAADELKLQIIGPRDTVPVTTPDERIINQAAETGYEGRDVGEATEWTRAVEKGLPMDQESRMERARAMGFDTGTVWYHGAAEGGFVKNVDIKAFDPNKVGDRYGADDRGFFFTNQKTEASGYASSDGQGMPARGAVYPVFLLHENPLIVTDETVLERFDTMGPGNEGNVSFWDNNQTDIKEWVKEGGHDAVIVDDGDYQMTVVFNPNQIRSVNAAFDPDYRDSPNLLAQQNFSGLEFEEKVDGKTVKVDAQRMWDHTQKRRDMLGKLLECLING
jgi:hypothetical protein